MMVFTHNPTLPDEESLRGFNERMNQFCQEFDVISVKAHTLGRALIVQMLTGDDMPAPPGTPILCPTFRQIDAGDASLEASIQAVVDGVTTVPEGVEDPEVTPVELLVLPANAKDKGDGWLGVVSIIGMIVPDDGSSDDDEDDDDDDDDDQGGYMREQPESPKVYDAEVIPNGR